jgi:hypothetical protein
MANQRSSGIRDSTWAIWHCGHVNTTQADGSLFRRKQRRDSAAAARTCAVLRERLAMVAEDLQSKREGARPS